MASSDTGEVMSNERVSGPDPARTLALLWGVQAQPTRGPRPSLDVEEIVETAIEIADTEGLAAVSMRRVAETLGFTTMSLYRYVPSKDDLLELMVDRAAAPSPLPSGLGDWRAALRWWARDTMATFRARPWLLEVPLNTAPLGPNQVTRMEQALRAMSETGLSGEEMLGVLMLLSGYIRGHAQLTGTLTQAEPRTGVSDEEWDTTYARMLQQHVTEQDFPALAGLVASGAFAWFGQDWQDTDFEFGLERILDAVGILVEGR